MRDSPNVVNHAWGKSRSRGRADCRGFRAMLRCSPLALPRSAMTDVLPPLIFLPGWSFGAHAWRDFAAAMSPRWPTRCLDLPGHGESPWDTFPVDPQMVCANLAARVEQPAMWLGWSLGGMVALAMARYFPEKVLAVGMIGAGPRFTACADWPWAMAREEFVGFQAGFARQPERTMRRFLSLQAVAGEDLRMLRALRQAAPPAREAALRGGLDALATWDFRAEPLAAPIWLALGSEDRLMPAALGQHWPVHRRLIIPGAGHAPFLTHPRTLAQGLEAFIHGI